MKQMLIEIWYDENVYGKEFFKLEHLKKCLFTEMNIIEGTIKLREVKTNGE